MMRQRIDKLGDINRLCSTNLLKNFEREGIAHWWKKTASPKGSAVFAYYDSTSTCLRLMPNASRFFQAALSNELISQHDASLLSRKLLATLHKLLPTYNGAFADELNAGPVGNTIGRAIDGDDFSLHEAHQNLAPDDLYAAMPWPLMPELHFRLSKFSPAGIRGQYITRSAQNPLRAMNLAVEITTLGPSINVSATDIETFLDWMNQRPEMRDIDALQETMELQKLVVPAFNGGFQGIAFGLFRNLPEELQPFVMGQLHQFAASIGEHLAYHRDQHLALALERAQTLQEYALAFMEFLPPVEHAVFSSGSDLLGYKINREGEYLAAYSPLWRDEARHAFEDPANDIIEPNSTEPTMQIRIKMLAETTGLNPVFTMLRLRPRLSVLPALSTDETRLLTRAELGAIYHGLRRQVLEGRGQIAASKKLYFIDAVLQHFEDGEVSLSNNRAREYTKRALGKTIAGYHVVGKAAKRFEAEIEKLVPSKFIFESISTHTLRVRWRAKTDQLLDRSTPKWSRV